MVSPKAPAKVLRDLVITHGDLSHLNYAIGHFGQIQRWLGEDRRTADQMLSHMKKDRASALKRIEEFVRLRTRSTPAGPPCPAWGTPTITLPRDLLRNRGGQSGFSAMTARADVNEASGTGISGRIETVNLDNGVVNFSGSLTNSSIASPHWYANWVLEAIFPPSPFDGTLDYGLDLWLWFIWNTSSTMGWLNMFSVARCPGPVSSWSLDSSSVCDMDCMSDLNWPNDYARDHGTEEQIVGLSGRAPVRAGDVVQLRLTTHIYAGVLDGLLSFRGSFAPVAEWHFQPTSPVPRFGVAYTFFPSIPPDT